MIHDWNWVSDYLSITLEIIAQFSRLNLWAFRTTRCGSFSTVNSMAKRRSQISMSIIAVKVLIKYDFGRCRRLLRPPTRLWNCPWCRTASTALCYLHTCPWFRTELLHGIKLVRSPSSKNSGTKLRGRTHKMFGISVGISLNNWGTQDWNFRWEFANSVSGWRARGPCARSSRSTAWGTFASGPFLWEVELHHMIVYDMIFRNFCSASQFGRKIFPSSRTFFWINIFW